jgi:hypothetical protein
MILPGVTDIFGDIGVYRRSRRFKQQEECHGSDCARMRVSTWIQRFIAGGLTSSRQRDDIAREEKGMSVAVTRGDGDP